MNKKEEDGNNRLEHLFSPPLSFPFTCEGGLFLVGQPKRSVPFFMDLVSISHSFKSFLFDQEYGKI